MNYDLSPFNFPLDSLDDPLDPDDTQKNLYSNLSAISLDDSDLTDNTTNDQPPAALPPPTAPEPDDKPDDTDTNNDDNDTDNTEFEVEKFVASEEIDGIPHYKIRWAGFSPSKDTWEPPTNIKPDTILEYKLENNMLITPAELTAHDPLDANNTMHFLNNLKGFNGFADADVQDDIAANLLELQPKCSRGTPGCKPEQHTRMSRDGRPRTR